MTPTGAAKLAGVIGWPVAHSLSPMLHGYWLKEFGVDGLYAPLPVRREDFSRVVEGLRLAGFQGINVTVPHKEAAFAVADSFDRAAEIAGAANLLVFGADGRIAARNTDADGLAASLKEFLDRHALRGLAAAILGAGGAARAAVLALDALGANEIRLVNRNEARAAALVSALQPSVKSKLIAFAWADWTKAAASDTVLVVNATSAGMKGGTTLEIPLEPLPASAVVCDLVYNPLETDFLKRARRRRHKTVDGLGMLMHQAVPAFEAFFGVKPQVTPALRHLLEKALHGG